jgi:hypothetical protein
MATNHDIALNTLLNVGIQQGELESVLASNCVLDWFGRTVAGRATVVNYFLNSNNKYEHSMTNAETIDAFEERLMHLTTWVFIKNYNLNFLIFSNFCSRCQPADNQRITPELFGDEVWYDCETHAPVDLKATLRTPPRNSSILQCPGAPCRQNLLQNIDSDDDDELSRHDSDSDDFEEGIQPLDNSFELISSEETSRTFKRQRRDKRKEETEAIAKTISDEQSKYSSLQYLEVSGSVIIRRQAATSSGSSSSRDDFDRRECKMLISYRVNKDNANDVQIALIVYKNSSTNVKSRRNLMLEFDDRVDDSREFLLSTPASTLSSSARSQTTAKEQDKCQTEPLLSTISAGEKTARASKRPFTSRNRLRF